MFHLLSAIAIDGDFCHWGWRVQVELSYMGVMPIAYAGSTL